MGIFGKFGAVFGSMPPSVLGGMQVFLYSTIAVAGVRVLSLVKFTRRNRFILTAALGIGFVDIVSPNWFGRILDYSGPNVHLQAAVIGVVLNLTLPEDSVTKNDDVIRDRDGIPMLAPSHQLMRE